MSRACIFVLIVIFYSMHLHLAAMETAQPNEHHLLPDQPLEFLQLNTEEIENTKKIISHHSMCVQAECNLSAIPTIGVGIIGCATHSWLAGAATLIPGAVTACYTQSLTGLDLLEYQVKHKKASCCCYGPKRTNRALMAVILHDLEKKAAHKEITAEQRRTILSKAKTFYPNRFGTRTSPPPPPTRLERYSYKAHDCLGFHLTAHKEERQAELYELRNKEITEITLGECENSAQQH